MEIIDLTHYGSPIDLTYDDDDDDNDGNDDRDELKIEDEDYYDREDNELGYQHNNELDLVMVPDVPANAADDPGGMGYHIEPACDISQRDVVALFPNICLEFLRKLGEEHEWISEAIIAKILDDVEQNKPYPQAERVSLKRKREIEENDPAKRYDSLQRRRALKLPSYKKTCEELLAKEYPDFYAKDVAKIFRDNASCLYPTVMAINKKLAASDAEHKPFQYKRRLTAKNQYGTKCAVTESRSHADPGIREAIEEYLTVREKLGFTTTTLPPSKRQLELQEEENVRLATMEGTMTTCDCCADDFPFNRMVHCEAVNELHLVCRDCARRNAEMLIGQGKYELVCFTGGSGCTKGFAPDQRKLFLDANTTKVLDKLEQNALLRLAGVENLVTCPFCPFTAECPPMDEDWEFRCDNPECKIVSCRRCSKETHAPLTCEEHAKRTDGEHVRHAIEEAMSAALIRKCNKCQTPFVKTEGCNKMTCTTAGCRNMQCYICGKSCDYNHFKERGNTGSSCQLYDANQHVEDRHRNEVRVAEEAARQKAAAENPHLDLDTLQIKIDKRVEEEDQLKRTGRTARVAHPHRPAVPPVPLRLDINAVNHNIPVRAVGNDALNNYWGPVREAQLAARGQGLAGAQMNQVIQNAMRAQAHERRQLGLAIPGGPAVGPLADLDRIWVPRARNPDPPHPAPPRANNDKDPMAGVRMGLEQRSIVPQPQVGNLPHRFQQALDLHHATDGNMTRVQRLRLEFQIHTCEVQIQNLLRNQGNLHRRVGPQQAVLLEQTRGLIRDQQVQLVRLQQRLNGMADAGNQKVQPPPAATAPVPNIVAAQTVPRAVQAAVVPARAQPRIPAQAVALPVAPNLQQADLEARMSRAMKIRAQALRVAQTGTPGR